MKFSCRKKILYAFFFTLLLWQSCSLHMHPVEISFSPQANPPLFLPASPPIFIIGVGQCRPISSPPKLVSFCIKIESDAPGMSRPQITAPHFSVIVAAPKVIEMQITDIFLTINIFHVVKYTLQAVCHFLMAGSLPGFDS